MPDTPAVVVIGIGNDFRHDDAVGLEVARLVRRARLDNVIVVGGVSDDYALLNAWQECDCAYVVDATTSGSEPGTIRSYDALADNIPAELFSSFSTHTLNIPKTIELARTLARLPRQLTVIGIEGGNFTHGEGLSPKLEQAAAEVAASIIHSCRSLSRVSK
ncbi:MAG: hydrogenase maturation protease [bacterium]